jgi:hypothetical protein
LPARFPQFKENEYFSTKSLNASHLSQVWKFECIIHCSPTQGVPEIESTLEEIYVLWIERRHEKAVKEYKCKQKAIKIYICYYYIFEYVIWKFTDPSSQAVCGRLLAAIAGFKPVGGQRCPSLVNVVFCQAEVSATGRSLFQRNPTDCGWLCVIQKPQEWGRLGPFWAVAPDKIRFKFTKLLTQIPTHEYTQRNPSFNF